MADADTGKAAAVPALQITEMGRAEENERGSLMIHHEDTTGAGIGSAILGILLGCTIMGAVDLIRGLWRIAEWLWGAL